MKHGEMSSESVKKELLLLLYDDEEIEFPVFVSMQIWTSTA